MHFYTNVFARGNYIYIRGYKDNKFYQNKINYKPYLFLPKENGKYTTLNNKDVYKKEFDSIREAKDFIKQYEDVGGFEYYGLTQFQYLYIYDTFHGEIQYDTSLVSVVSIDIECAADEGFPNIQLADKEITAITIRKNKHSYVFGCGEFKTNDKSITYIKCKDEYTLLSNFLKVWEFHSIRPDVITGWNIEYFDIPYLYNRIKFIMGESEAKRLSPWGFVDEKLVEFKGKTNQTYNILGISTLDYYQLYRKFTFGNQESYKLDYIASVELDETKVDYSEYGSLLELYKNNYQKFIEYNIIDVILVDKLEEKLKFIEQVMAFAYDAKVNYIDTMATVKPWDVIIHNYLLDRRIVIPQFKKQSMDKSLVGGYVKDPKIGMSKWVVSFDVNSMYPTNIIQFNIGPDTQITKNKLRNMLKALK